MTATQPSVTLASKATPSDEVLIQEVGGESVLLDLASERYFGLNPVGTRIWALLDEHDTLQAIADTLCAEFDAEPERIRGDLVILISELAEAGLVKVE